MLSNIFFLILSIFNVHPPQTCRLNSRIHFGEPLPVILRNGRLLEPTDKYGNVDLEKGEILTLSCISSSIRHLYSSRELATANIICNGGTSFSNDEWLSSNADFGGFRCDLSPDHSSKRTNRTCYSGHSIIEVGYRIDNEFYPLYESCFDNIKMNAIYSKYTQSPFNAKYQTGVGRLFFKDDDNYYGSIPVESGQSIFSPWNQKSAIAKLVGHSIIDNYCNTREELSRGHLAAKTDFVFAFGERASFHYVNCAPQWKGFNGGNWNTLEVDLRDHIHNNDYETIIYTGTYGVSQLEDHAGRKVDLHLETENNNPVIPVPRYFYKVVYEPSTKRGIAFVGINNPYLSISEAERICFCEDICRDNKNFRWLSWQPRHISEGYSFCCTVPDFRNTVKHLPEFEVTGLFF